MVEEQIINKESGYDQKAFLQLRLHQNLSKLDELNFQLPQFRPSQQLEIYNCQFNILASILSTIYSKLNPTEKEEANKLRVEISNMIKATPKPHWGRDARGREGWFFITLSTLSESLIKFRFLLEELMDAHGFNPSKENVGQAIAKQ